MFDIFSKLLKDEGCSFNIKYKNKSLLMKIISFILFFNQKFMTDYTTTIGNTIYVPNESFIINNEEGFSMVLAHELVHIEQAKKNTGIIFSLAYLFPQCLAIFSLLSIFAFVWFPFIWCLLFLLFAAPLPAPFRAKFELEGYTMSLFMYNLYLERLGYAESAIISELHSYADKINNVQFKGSGYYFMWPFGKDDDLKKKIIDIRNGVISDTDEIYDRVRRSYLKSVSAYD